MSAVAFVQDGLIHVVPWRDSRPFLISAEAARLWRDGVRSDLAMRFAIDRSRLIDEARD